MAEVPDTYRVDEAAEEHTSRFFKDAELELHAQDKDHSGRGWAAVLNGFDHRARLKLMAGVKSEELWGSNRVVGDVTVVFDRVGTEYLPREIHLHRIDRRA